MTSFEVIPARNTDTTAAGTPGGLAALLEAFIDYTSVKETTLNGYKVYLRHFAEWIRENHITQPTRTDIKAYKAHLDTYTSPRTGKPLTAGTRSQYFRACKHFFKWTAAEGLYPNIADNIKGPKHTAHNRHKDALSAEDTKNILATIDTRTTTGKRDFCMILLAITGGLRIIEMQRANIDDIKTIAGEKVLFIQGKGRDEKDEYKKLPQGVTDALAAYLTTRPNAKKSDPLFTGTSNRAKDQRITEPSISRIIKTAFRAAGYDSDRLTAHSLRHTGITLLLQSGASLQEAQAFARHADPKTTEIYAHNLDRAKDKSEQTIYNQIFTPGAPTAPPEAFFTMAGEMTPEQIKAAITLLSALAERSTAT